MRDGERCGDRGKDRSKNGPEEGGGTDKERSRSRMCAHNGNRCHQGDDIRAGHC